MRGAVGGDGAVPKGVGEDVSGAVGGMDPRRVTPTGVMEGREVSPVPPPPWGVFNAAVSSGCPGMNLFHEQE